VASPPSTTEQRFGTTASGRQGTRVLSRQEAEGVRQAIRGAVDRESIEEGSFDILVRVHGQQVEVEVEVRSELPPEPEDEVRMHLFGDWLSRLLRSRNLSQEAAARRIVVSLKTVSRWIRGETEPRFRELLLVCDALGEAPELLRGSADGEPK
jgi:DNA-binding Xre family transcriptional regulator